MESRIVVLASGSGTNAENIIRHFSSNPIAKVVAVFCNNPNAGVLSKAERLQTPTYVFTKKDLFEEKHVLEKLKWFKADWIVLAGFLLKIPENIIHIYKDKIINIHPALLPKYGGKGMYGMHVHNAVVANSEPKTGITIHLVNEHYDDGAIIFQQAVALQKDDSPEDVFQKIHALEQQYFPTVIENFIQSKDGEAQS